MAEQRKNEAQPTDEIAHTTMAEEVNEELDRLGQGGRWVWSLFLISTLPNILNGFHVSSYIFVGKLPDEYWCEIPRLVAANWTRSQIKSITSNHLGTDPCRIIDYDYDHLSTMTFESAVEFTSLMPFPADVSCLSNSNARMLYSMEGDSIVPEWDLVCENSVWRTIVQTSVSLGKCVGALSVGILSDKFGRKKLFGVGSIIYTAASLLVAFTPWYWMFLIGRACLGLASSGLFYPSLIMMTENVAPKHRYWMGIGFNIAYPLGMAYLALAAFFLHNWRDLQLALTIPAAVLFLFWYLFRESPRWLLSKGRIENAYSVVFGKKHKSVGESSCNDLPTDSQTMLTDPVKSGGVFKELAILYSTSKQRRVALICHFAYFSSAFSYYVTAINADNLSANKVIYVLATGGVDLLAVFVNIALLRNIGRRWGCMLSFGLSGICMLVLLAIPHDQHTWVVSVALLGRLGVTIVYAIVTLYTSELFPTEIRNSAVGVSSMFGHIGSMLAPFVVDFLGRLGWFIPTTIVGSILFLSAVLVLMNPETHQQKLNDFVQNQEETEPHS